MNHSCLIRSLLLLPFASLAISCSSNKGSDPYASNPYYGPQGAYGDNGDAPVYDNTGGYVAPAPAEPNYSAPPPAPAASSGGGGSKTYTVASGDNLYRISLRHGTTVNAIKNANGLSSDLIHPGQKLRIP